MNVYVPNVKCARILKETRWWMQDEEIMRLTVLKSVFQEINVVSNISEADLSLNIPYKITLQEFNNGKDIIARYPNIRKVSFKTHYDHIKRVIVVHLDQIEEHITAHAANNFKDSIEIVNTKILSSQKNLVRVGPEEVLALSMNKWGEGVNLSVEALKRGGTHYVTGVWI